MNKKLRTIKNKNERVEITIFHQSGNQQFLILPPKKIKNGF